MLCQAAWTAEPIERGTALQGPTVPTGESTNAWPEDSAVAITGLDVGRSAADRWIPSQLLRDRAMTVRHLYQSAGADRRRGAAVLANFFCTQADYQDSVGAAAGMKAYYAWIAAGTQLGIIESAVEQLHEQQQLLQRLIESGVTPSFDLSSIERADLKLQDLRLQAQQQQRQAATGLLELTGLDLQEAVVERLDVMPTALDCDGLQTLALSTRADLQAWRNLYRCTDAGSADMLARALNTGIGNWGIPLPPQSRLPQLFGCDRSGCLAADLRREIWKTIELQERWIRIDVGEKCAHLETAYQRMELAAGLVASWRSRLERLEELERYGRGRPEEAASASAELHQAEAEWVMRRFEARLAEIELAESIGGLARRCREGSAWFVAAP
ncbi:MAG: hypothetical protein D6753_07630 [Planctomycetota bacterium]|nr:MAG: hypothetical protein D6753_07630 [Planctomycetota bacterium]